MLCSTRNPAPVQTKATDAELRECSATMTLRVAAVAVQLPAVTCRATMFAMPAATLHWSVGAGGVQTPTAPATRAAWASQLCATWDR